MKRKGKDTQRMFYNNARLLCIGMFFSRNLGATPVYTAKEVKELV